MSYVCRTDHSAELKWMQEVNGKKEIEAVCDTWKGGLEGYLVWKIKRILGLEEDDMDWVGSDDWDEDLVDIAEFMDDMDEI
jgi:hypothetical protein